MIDKICLYCKKDIKNPKNCKKYCSKSCSAKARIDLQINRWLKGEISGGGWWGTSRTIKRWLIEKYGEKCSICGWNIKHLITGRVPLQIDHMDGNPYNHRPENLRLLCPNCHSLTTTWGGFNKGHGRKERYQKHKQNKIKMPNKCLHCEQYTYNNTYCSLRCSSISKRKVQRPSKDELEQSIKNMPWIHIGKKYGVSDNAVRKWAKSYNLL